jgi:lysozyme family protein
MTSFDEAFTKLVGHEGGYANDPRDPGGETMWGVTAAVARANGYTGPMRLLSQEFAKGLYRAKYWDTINADALPDSVRFETFDMAVNSGPTQAIKLLQRAASVAEDGVLGPVTLAALKETDGSAILRRMQAYRLKFYTSLKTFNAFGAGWVNRVANNMLAGA